jgi:hypothetical protein
MRDPSIWCALQHDAFDVALDFLLDWTLVLGS